MEICIAVAAHKPYWMPSDKMYLPIEAGRALHGARTNFIGDDTGDNISAKNAEYCELTALYWAWKHLTTCDYLGLVHYRRHFAKRKLFCREKDKILSHSDAEAYLRQAPILLPKRRHYFIETNAQQYAHAHHAGDLAALRTVVAAHSPGSLPSFDAHMRARSTHICNMFVMRKDLADAYCQWLFSILFALEDVLDLSRYDPFQRRVYGFLAERLLDVWIDWQHIPYREAPVVCLEPQHWGRKGLAFLRRKFLPRAASFTCQRGNAGSLRVSP